MVQIPENATGAIVFDNLQDALLGFGRQYGKDVVAVYSENKIVETLIDQGMEPQDAREFYEFNIETLFAGDRTPVIIDDTNGDGI